MDQIPIDESAVRSGVGLSQDVDWNLVQRVRKGDLGAFEAIMRRHNRRLYRIARSILRNASEAEDVVQETYMKAYTKLATFNGPGGFPTWIGKIALNEARGRRRLQARMVSIDDDKNAYEGDRHASLTWLKSPAPDPEHLAMSAQLRVLMENAIDQLPDIFRSVFLLRVVEGMSIEETAALLSIPPRTVKTRLYRARLRLQHSFGADLNDLMPSVHQFDGSQCDRIVANVIKRITKGDAVLQQH